jgi:hypothetical protein
VFRRAQSIIGFGATIGFAAIIGVSIAGCSSDSDSAGGSTTQSQPTSPRPEASAEFCSFGEQFLDRGTALTAAMEGNDATLLKAATDDTTAQIDGMTTSAPTQIAADLAVVRSLYAEFVAVLDGGNYDLVALSSDPAAQAVVDKLNSPEASNASSRVETFLTDACGITTES